MTDSTNSVRDQIRKILFSNSYAYEARLEDYSVYLNEKGVEDVLDTITSLITEVETRAQNNCNAVLDDQLNDIHIKYFNIGYKKGRADEVALKETHDE